jgi:hypothetical protein
MEEIYDSVRGKMPVGKKQPAKREKEPDREPELDEM